MIRELLSGNIHTMRGPHDRHAEDSSGPVYGGVVRDRNLIDNSDMHNLIDNRRDVNNDQGENARGH